MSDVYKSINLKDIGQVNVSIKQLSHGLCVFIECKEKNTSCVYLVPSKDSIDNCVDNELNKLLKGI